MQNVNINQEVKNAMMAPPQQPRGIVDLLASELKARDAKARNQLNTMMAPAPDPNTIISQNEKETENNVRQEIMQKMQSMAVKENQNKARMNQALAGIAGQRANNMTRMANGGIVGYAGPDGSKVKAMAPQTPMAGQTQNPSPGYLDPEVATFLRELEKLNKQLEAAFPQEKDLFEQRITDLINTTSPRVKRIASDLQFGLPKKDGMAQGGIVGFDDGGKVGPTLYDEMGKQYLPGQPLPEGWQTLTNAPRKIQLPFNPAGEDFAGELREMERTRRERGDRTFLEALRDSDLHPTAGDYMRDVGARRRFTEKNPNFASQLKAMKEARERVLDAQEKGMAMGGIVGYATGGEIEAYLDSIGASAEYKANLTPEQTAAIGEMLDAQAAPEASRGIVERMAEVGRQMPGSNLGDRPTRDAVIEMLGSPVARGQNEVLSALPSGAMGLLQDRMSKLGPVSQGAAGANEEATERRRTGIAETLQNAMPEEGIVGRMARVGRQMPGSNLGDRPVRDAMMEGIASLAPPRNPGATSEAARQSSREDFNAKVRKINAGRLAGINPRQRVETPEQANAPRGSIREAASSFAEGSGLTELAQNSGLADIAAEMARGGEGFFSGLTDAYNTLMSPMPEGAPASYVAGARAKDLVTAPFDLVGGFLRPTRGNQLTIGDLVGGAEQFGRGALSMEPATDDAPTTTKAEEIIASGPSTTPAASAEPAYDPMKGVEAVADPNLRRAIEGAQAAPAPTGIAAPTAEQDDEVAATQLASTVASNPTPQNMSRFESEISRLMERRESPVRALSSFLKAFSQARGGSMGQNLAIATTAMNAADDAMDKQIIALEQLRRADQISERDFGLKKTQIENEKSYRDAMGAYYQNIPVVQKEIEELRQAGRTDEADRRLRESAVLYAMPMRAILNTRAKDELGRGATAEQIQDKANKLFEEEVETYIKVVQNSSGASPNSAVQEGATATNAQGDKVVFTNGAWAPM